MTKIADINEKIAENVVKKYKKIEKTVVEGYNHIENNAIEGFNKVSDKCIDVLFAKEGETIEEARERLKNE